MARLCSLLVAILAFFAITVAGAGHLHGSVRKASLAGTASKLPVAGTGSLVAPIRFDQKLLLCNAYDSPGQSISMWKNGQWACSRLRFGECRYMPIDVRSNDKLDFMDSSAGVQGTFEVEDPPDADAVLLLVLQHRDQKSPLLSFQSFALPLNQRLDEANVAIIDATPGLDSAHLVVEDLPATNTVPAAGRPQRGELLSFNRIYALERGAYKFGVEEAGARINAVDEVELNGRQNYVVIRTRDTEGRASLLTYPRERIAPQSSAVRPVALAALLVAAAGALV